MNIWITNHYAIPPSLGGLNRHYYFKRELEKKGHNVKILTSGKIHNTDLNIKEKGKLFCEKECDGEVYTYISSLDYSGNGIKRILSFVEFPVKLFRTMKRLIKKERPDIIYASSPEIFGAAASILFGRKYEIPVVLEIRDAWPDSVVTYSNLTKKNPIIKILYKLERWLYKNADKVIFTWAGGMDYIKDKEWDLQSGGPVDLNKIYNVNNGVDIEQFDYNAKKYPYSYPDEISDKFIITYTGSIRRVNRIDLILSVAKKMRDQEDIFFAVFGDGNYREELIKKAQEYGLNNISFFGHVAKKHIPGILEKSNLNIIVGENHDIYKYGMSPNKIFDYMASGKPILSNIECGYSGIKKYNCGLVVKNGNIDALADGIMKIKMMTRKEYELISQNARRAAEDFDYKNLAGNIEKILIEAVDDSN